MQSRTISSSRKRAGTVVWPLLLATMWLLVGCESSDQKAQNREFEKVANEHSILNKMSFDGYKPTFEKQQDETTGPGGHNASIDRTWEMPEGVALENFKAAIATIRKSGAGFTQLRCGPLYSVNAVRQVGEWYTGIELLLSENTKLSAHESYDKRSYPVSSLVADQTIDDSCPDELKSLIKPSSSA